VGGGRRFSHETQTVYRRTLRLTYAHPATFPVPIGHLLRFLSDFEPRAVIIVAIYLGGLFLLSVAYRLLAAALRSFGGSGLVILASLVACLARACQTSSSPCPAPLAQFWTRSLPSTTSRPDDFGVSLDPPPGGRSSVLCTDRALSPRCSVAFAFLSFVATPKQAPSGAAEEARGGLNSPTSHDR